MILQINYEEVRALSVNLVVMRKQYKKLFKRAYNERKEELMVSYDYVLETLGEWLKDEINPLKETEVTSNKKYELYLDKEDAELLNEVLRSYIEKLEEMQKEVKKMIDGTEILKRILERSLETYRLHFVESSI